RAMTTAGRDRQGAARVPRESPMPRIFAPLFLVALACGPAYAQTRSDAPDLAALGRRYGLEVVTEAPKFPVKISTGVIDGAEAAKADADSYAPVFAFEWSLYPPDLVRRTGLRKVVFCKDLAYEKQKRTAVQDFEHDTLYLDVVRGRADEL